MSAIKVCKHCHAGKVNRPLGLCWNCYYTPGVRELHPSTSVYGRRGPGNAHRSAPLAADPTDAKPGSEEKIAVMQGRLARGEQLFHPGDPVVHPPPPHWEVPVCRGPGGSVTRRLVGSNVRPTAGADWGSGE